MRLFSALFLLLFGSAALAAGPDLDVTYIERTPRYSRYVIDESHGLPQQLKPGTDKDQRWPAPGETVRYYAHVMNKGTAPAGPFAYEFLVNGAVVKTGTSEGVLQPGQERTYWLQRTWITAPRRITFRADAANALAEAFEQNNELTVGSHDLTLAYWVERGIYDRFNLRANRTGTLSFEDWLQDYVRNFNERLASAVYPVAPQGIADRIRVDRIVVTNELDAPGSDFHNDPEVALIDGRWQSSDGDPDNSSGLAGGFDQWVNDHIGFYNDGWMHEVAHQYSLIDLYRFGIKPNDAGNPRGGLWVRHSNGNLIDYAELPFPVVSDHGGLMGGGTTSPHDDPGFLESHSAVGWNSAAGLRRGHFGDYLFDTPAQNRVKIVDAVSGAPIAGAAVAMFQKDYGTEDLDDAAEISGVTDAAGLMTLPNRPVVPIYTATGHVLRPNPFGHLSVLGVNGTMLVRVTKGANEGLGFFTLQDLNLAYWSGATADATHTVRVRMLPLAPPPANAPPRLNAIGSLFRVVEGEALTFTVSATDPANEPLAYSAERLPGGAAFANRQFTWTPAAGQAGFYSVKFKVTDPAGHFDEESVLISVSEPDRPPVARLPLTMLAGETAMVILDGGASSDPDGHALAYFWTQTAGPAVTLFDEHTATPWFTAPDVASITKLTFSLTVAAYSLTSAPATVEVAIHPNLPLTGTGRGTSSWMQACSGANRMLIVSSAEWRGSPASPPITVTYNGVPLTRLTSSFHPSTGPLATMWYLVNPPSGYFSVEASGDAAFVSSCWFDVKQVAPANATTRTGTSTNPSFSVPSTLNHVVVDALATFGGNPPGVSVQPGQSVLGRVTDGNARHTGSAKAGFAGSTLMGWTIEGSELRWAVVGAALERVP